jgi:hypothetical protein
MPLLSPILVMPARPSAVVLFRVRILSRVKTVAIAMAFQLGLRTPPGRARGDGSEGTTMLQMRIIGLFTPPNLSLIRGRIGETDPDLFR